MMSEMRENFWKMGWVWPPLSGSLLDEERGRGVVGGADGAEPGYFGVGCRPVSDWPVPVLSFACA